MGTLQHLGAPHGPVKLERPRLRDRERARSVVENREHSENRCPPRTMSSSFNGTENILAADEVMATDPVDNQDADVYNTNLQIAGVFIIVVASISGMGLSYLFGWIKSKGGMR